MRKIIKNYYRQKAFYPDTRFVTHQLGMVSILKGMNIYNMKNLETCVFLSSYILYAVCINLKKRKNRFYLWSYINWKFLFTLYEIL